jgi:type I restriction enzyme, R subunit
MLASSVLRYQDHALDAAAVVAELVELARRLKHEHERGAQVGLREDEVAFYDAIYQNDSAVLEMGDELLKKITRELVDGAPQRHYRLEREGQVRAGCVPPSAACSPALRLPARQQPDAIDIVMHQADLLAQAA